MFKQGSTAMLHAVQQPLIGEGFSEGGLASSQSMRAC